MMANGTNAVTRRCFGAAAAACALGAPAAALGKKLRSGTITPEVYNLAKKWAEARKLPFDWVLATILAESGGDRYKKGDYKDGIYRSLGLMQINRVAHKDLLKAFGIPNPTQLFDPNINIMLGTYLIREAWARVYRDSLGRASSAPLNELVRFSYVGPTPTTRAMREGKHPRDVFVDGPLVAAAWSQALADSKKLV